MAWRCTGRNNSELVANLESRCHKTTLTIEASYRSRNIYFSPSERSYVSRGQRRLLSQRSLPRFATGYWIWSDYIGSPYGSYLLPLAKTRFQHAAALEGLKDQITDGAKILDVGSGSGYLTACLALMVSLFGRSYFSNVPPPVSEHKLS